MTLCNKYCKEENMQKRFSRFLFKVIRKLKIITGRIIRNKENHSSYEPEGTVRFRSSRNLKTLRFLLNRHWSELEHQAWASVDSEKINTLQKSHLQSWNAEGKCRILKPIREIDVQVVTPRNNARGQWGWCEGAWKSQKPLNNRKKAHVKYSVTLENATREKKRPERG